MNEYVLEIEELVEDGTVKWLLKEAIMTIEKIDANILRNIVEKLEDHYQFKDVIDIDDERAKGSFVYEIKLNSFGLYINQIINEEEIKMLNGINDWKDLDEVSTENYIILNIDTPNEIMHFINRNDKYIRYGATQLSEFVQRILHETANCVNQQ